MSQAGTIDVEQANPTIPTSFDTDSGTAIPIANLLEILGSTVANATNAQPVFTTGSGNTVTIEVQVGAAITGSPADSNDAGLVSFDDSQFTVDANGFVQLIGGSMAIDTITGDDAVAVSPDGAGNFNFVGSIVANASNVKPLYFDGTDAANTETLELQVGAAITGAPANSNDAGIVSFDDTQFLVDVNGFVQLIGGSNAIDSNTGDDAVTVFPDAVGNFNWLGQTVANATHAKPVYFKDSVTANALDLDVQVSAAITGAPIDKLDSGLASFNDTQFTVSTHGYVALVGGADLPAIQTITSDDPTAVGPDASGNVNLTGEAVANATNAKPVFVDAGANALNIEVQVAAAVTGAPGDKLDAGLSSYDDSIFTVDADGYVSLATTGVATTITGDSGGALSPISNNWNILGLSGSKTSGSGATLTVKSPPYADQGVGTVTLNSGSFVTGAVTITLPASGGLADGDLIEIIATNGVVTIQLVGTQIAHLGTATTSAAGTITGSATGDAISLRYQSSTDDFWATSAVGVWVLA